MIVCEQEVGWNHPDPKDPRIALQEIDVYNWVTFEVAGVEGHRLSIRRVLATGRYELYRRFDRSSARRDEVLYTGDLRSTLDASNREWSRLFGGVFQSGARLHDSVCDHEHNRALRCPARRPRPSPLARSAAFTICVAAMLLLALPAAMPCALGHSTSASAGIASFTNVSYNSSVDGFPLSYWEYLPVGYNATLVYPLAIYLHGAGKITTPVRGGRGASQVMPGIVSAAGTAGFILISLNTRTGEGFYSNTPCGGPQEQDVLDAIAHERALRHVGAVYLIGFSMGSIGALTLIAEHPGSFAGAATAGTITDAFETQAYNNARGAVVAGWAYDECGASLFNGSSVATAFAYHLSPLRFYPENFSGVRLFLDAGALDDRAPNNFSRWPYAEANSTVLNASCAVEAQLGEPPSCTTPLEELASAHPLAYDVAYLWEPNAGHTEAQLDPAALFQFFEGTLAAGLYHAAFPPKKLIPGA